MIRMADIKSQSRIKDETSEAADSHFDTLTMQKNANKVAPTCKLCLRQELKMKRKIQVGFLLSYLNTLRNHVTSIASLYTYYPLLNS